MLHPGFVQGGHYRTIKSKNQEKCLSLIEGNQAPAEKSCFSGSAAIRSWCTFSSVARTWNILLALICQRVLPL